MVIGKFRARIQVSVPCSSHNPVTHSFLILKIFFDVYFVYPSEQKIQWFENSEVTENLSLCTCVHAHTLTHTPLHLFCSLGIPFPISGGKQCYPNCICISFEKYFVHIQANPYVASLSLHMDGSMLFTCLFYFTFEIISHCY